MSDMQRFFDLLSKNISKFLHTATPAKVLSYDSQTLSASVQPLASFDGRPYPVIDGVPVAHSGNADIIIHTPLKVDDIVIVIFCENDIDNTLLGNETQETNTERNHSLDDAIIVGKINIFTELLTELNATDIHIGTKDGVTKVIIKPSGEVVIEASTIKLGEGATEGVLLGTSWKNWADSHTHSDPVSGTTSTPNQSSPAPSSKVVVE